MTYLQTQFIDSPPAYVRTAEDIAVAIDDAIVTLPYYGDEEIMPTIPDVKDDPIPKLSEDEDESIPNDEQDQGDAIARLIALALSDSATKAARAFEYEGNYVVAVLTEPYYLKSERDRAREEMENSLREQTGIDSISVLFDAEIYRKIRDGITPEQKQALFELAMGKL